MMQDKLATELEAFHQCLVEAPSIDAATREKLKTLIGEIQTALASHRPADALHLETKVPDEETFQQRVDKFIHDFEVQHPQLTTNLAIIAERLADMGI